jgi:hypothetical protein
MMGMGQRMIYCEANVWPGLGKGGWITERGDCLKYLQHSKHKGFAPDSQITKALFAPDRQNTKALSRTVTTPRRSSWRVKY